MNPPIFVVKKPLLLGVNPESFQSIDVYFAPSEALRAIDFQMLVAARYMAIIASVFVVINDTGLHAFFHHQSQGVVSPDVWHNFQYDLAGSFKDTKELGKIDIRLL